jgi:ribose transport system permease protein
MTEQTTTTPPAAASVEPPAADGVESTAARAHEGWSPARLTDVLGALRGQGLVLMLVVVVVYFWRTSPFFLTSSNLLLIGSTGAALGIMALAQTFLIISGGVDLSVGSVVGLTGVIIGLLFAHGTNIWVAAGVGVLAGMGVGIVNGFLAVVMQINPLIVSLGTLSFFAGLADQLTNGQTLVVSNNSFNYLGAGKVGPIPFALVVFIALAALAWFVQRYTTIGRNIYAIGGNTVAATLSGLRVRRLQFGLYVLSGMSAGVAGVMITSQLNGASTQVGGTFLLSVVTAVVLGGTSLAGGIGSIRGTIVAVLILQCLQNGFGLLGYTAAVQTMALGVVLIIAVLMDQFSRRRRG